MVSRQTFSGVQPSSSSRSTSSSAALRASSAVAAHESHIRPVTAPGVHAARRQRTESSHGSAWCSGGCGRAPAAPAHRGSAEPREDALVLVRVDVEAAVVLVAQRRQDRAPPAVREVLGLVDDDRVVLLLVGQLLGQVAHQRAAASPPRTSLSSRVPSGAPHCRPNSSKVPTKAGRCLRCQPATCRLRYSASPME